MSDVQTTPGISVKLTLFADLKRFLPKGQDGTLRLNVSEGATVVDLMKAAAIPADEDVTVGINGDQGTRDSKLKDGDDVVLFSQMEGG